MTSTAAGEETPVAGRVNTDCQAFVAALSSTGPGRTDDALRSVCRLVGRYRHRVSARWQLADGDRVTTCKTYHETHDGPFLGIAPTHRKIHFESVDVMRVQNGKITDNWGAGNLLSLMQQIGGWTPPPSAEIAR